jgi:3-isopropylmalate/(R)-2-methylmalate dehydratase small subunit
MGSRQIDQVRGRPVPLRGHDIDTDRIIPARYLKQVTFEGLEKGVFEDDRKALVARGGRHSFDDPRFRGGSILIVNRNFGCGSSREHAPQALQRWGITAILGESYSDIFFGNALVMGLPCLRLDTDSIDMLMAAAEAQPDEEISISLNDLSVKAGPHTFTGAMPASAREALLTGTWDATGLLLDGIEQIKTVATRLPYLTSC